MAGLQCHASRCCHHAAAPQPPLCAIELAIKAAWRARHRQAARTPPLPFFYAPILPSSPSPLLRPRAFHPHTQLPFPSQAEPSGPSARTRRRPRHGRRSSVGRRGALLPAPPRHKLTPKLALSWSSEASRPVVALPPTPEQRRRSSTPPASHCSAAHLVTGRPRPRQAYLRVALASLLPFPHFPAAGEPSPRRETPAATSPVLGSGQGHVCEPPICSRGLDARLHFLFLFVLKNSKLVNSFKNRRKIRKMQTQLFWNLCKEIYNFFYMHFFICSIVFTSFKMQRKCALY